MSKEIKNNKNKQTIDKQKTIKQSKWFRIVGLSVSIILLVLVLIGLLKLNANVKSESDKIKEQFDIVLKSSNPQIIYYYDSSEEENEEGLFELEYIKKISKDYKIDYYVIDKNKLQNKDMNYIYQTVGISGKTPTTIIVKDSNILGVQEGYKEANRLVEFMVHTGILEEGSTYKELSNLKFIDYDEYKKLLDNKKKKSIVIIGQPACEYCINIKKMANNISKAYEVTINYLDVMELKASERKEFFDKIPTIGYNEESIEQGVFGMPTTFIVKDKKIVAYYKGAESVEKFVAFLKEQKVIE